VGGNIILANTDEQAGKLFTSLAEIMQELNAGSGAARLLPFVYPF
jgi:hypothetical protein